VTVVWTAARGWHETERELVLIMLPNGRIQWRETATDEEGSGQG
jgi:hypothetical protein